MHAIQPSRADLASILTDEERVELQGYLWGSILSGPISVPTGERIREIEKEIEERWLYDPNNHLADPGPDHWAYRCLQCGEDVFSHVRLLEYLTRKVRAWVRAHTNS